jgi:DHA1 family inner membrane transport protein
MTPPPMPTPPPPSPPPPPAAHDRLPPLLLLFLVVNLLIGTAGFMTTGMLGPMAQSLGTSVAAVGQATTAYAIATAALAPLLLACTARLPPRRALLVALGVFALGAVLTALASDLWTLLAARAVMGAGAAASAVMAGIAIGMVAPGRRARALSVVFMGMSLSYVTGIPAAAWAGLTWGWHVPAWTAALLCLAALVAVRWGVPSLPRAPAPAVGTGAWHLLSQPTLRRSYLITFTYFVAIMSVFTYIGPVLVALVPMDGRTLSAAISLFGLAGVTGTLVGGRSGDRFGMRGSVTVSLSGLALSMTLLPLTAGHPVAMMAVMLVWGVSGFSIMAPQQSHIAALAGAQAPLALSLNSSMVYLGTAAGGAVGGLALQALPLERLPWVGVPMALLALALLRLGPGRSQR